MYGKAANEANFKQELPHHNILHLAMHGLVDAQYPEYSALAFTDDKDSLEDDFLYVHEIKHQSIDADLVVLSACETGYGKYQRGEGVVSLGRSFMYAGVPALVVSLWAVNDVSTGELMNYFYDNLAKNVDKSEALRQAKLQYLKNTNGVSTHPVYWAAFVQVGDSRPVAIKAYTASANWLWWLGGVIAAAVLFVGIRRKMQQS